jgi:hypothetical protein
MTEMRTAAAGNAIARLRRRLSYANVMATIAVFIALGGTATAGFIVASSEDVAPETINSEHLIDGEVSGRDIAPGTINSEHVSDGQITGRDIADLSLGLADYGANSISTGKLKDQDVRTADLRDLGVTNPKIAWDSISSGKVINNNLTSDDLGAGSVDTSELRNGGIAADDFGLLPAVLAHSPGASFNAPNCTSALAFQQIPDSPTALAFWNEEFDTASMHAGGIVATGSTCSPQPDADVVVAPLRGIYQVSAGLVWTHNPLGKRSLGLYANDWRQIALDERRANDESTTGQHVGTLVQLEAGDRVSAKASQTAAAILSVEQSRRSFLAMNWVGPAAP